MDLFSQAFAKHQQGQLGEACTLYRQVLAQHPQHADALHLYAVALGQTGRLDEGLHQIRLAARLKPADPAIQNNQGNLLQASGRLDEAIASFSQAVTLNPRYAEAFNNRANAHQAQGRFEQAIADYQQATELQTDYTEAYYNCGIAHQQLGQHLQAVERFNQAWALQPQTPEIQAQIAISAIRLNQLGEAQQAISLALDRQPDSPDFLQIQGNLFNIASKLEEAINCYQKIVRLAPDRDDPHANLAMIYLNANRPREAQVHADQSLRINTGNPLALSAKALLAIGDNDLTAAQGYLQKIPPVHHSQEAVLTTAGLLQSLTGNHEAAIESLQRALTINPHAEDALLHLGTTYMQMGDAESALAPLQQAHQLFPQTSQITCTLLQCMLDLCYWKSLEEISTRLLTTASEPHQAVTQLTMLTLFDKPDFLLACARQAASVSNPVAPRRQPQRKPRSGRKFKIGLFSADLRKHPVGMLLLNFLKIYDREKFEFVAFALDAPKDDPVRRAYQTHLDHFVEAHAMSDKALATCAHQYELDVAIDLMGYTHKCRPGIFHHRLAPLQVAYLGYPGSTGNPCMDYLIADRIVIPEQAQRFYSEKVAYLPHCFFPGDAGHRLDLSLHQREQQNLPNDAVVLCCFNNAKKITPDLFDSWLRILKRTENSVLWLKVKEPNVQRNLIDQAGLQGIPSSRLVFALHVNSHEEHLARYLLADLFLDTFPYNAHTTASEALWAGLPLLTLAGQSFASRVAASMLNAVGLEELICHEQLAYENRAIELIKDPGQLRLYRQRLADRKSDSPLFDSRRFARDFEALLIDLIQEQRSRLD